MAIKFQDLVLQAEQHSTQRLRVAFVLPCLNAGGAERVSISLMNGLDPKRFDAHLVSLTSDGPLRDWIGDHVQFHGLGNGRVSRSLLRLAREIRRIRPDIVVSSMAHMNFGLLLIKPFLPKNTKILVREANIPSSIAENEPTPWLVRLAYRMLYKHADQIISPAACIIEEFDHYVGLKSKSHVLLHNPVDLPRIRDEQREIQHVDDKRRKTVQFVCSGRLHNQKGFDRLVDHLPFFSASYDWHLTILGEGPKRAKIQAIIDRHNLHDRVSMPGHVKNPWLIYAAADCFLLPSRWEGLPNVVLESLAVGTPVIATSESGGIQEIADLAPEGSVQVAADMPAFIKAMERVKPIPTASMRDSLLPPSFTMDAVTSRFAAILEGKELPSLATPVATNVVPLHKPSRVA